MSLDPRRLRYFLAIAEKMTMAKAAEVLGVAQPTLSQQIRALEVEIGTVLFDRTVRGMALTKSGEVLRRHAERLLAEETAALQSIRELEGGESGHVSVGIIHTYNTAVLPPVIKAYRLSHPNVTLDICEATSLEVENGIINGRFELGIAFAPPISPEIACERLFVERLALICSPAHRLASCRQVSRSEIAADVPLALLTRAFATRRLIDAAFEGISPPKVMVEMNSIEALIEIARSGAAPTILADKSLLGRQNVAVIPIEPDPIIRIAGLIWHIQRYQTGAARAFSACVRRLCVEESASQHG